MRGAPESRGTLKPSWNNIPDETVTDYTPHTISLNTDNRENTRIGKSDLAIATEAYQKPTPTQTEEQKLRSLPFVACKIVSKQNRNEEKIKQFCLEQQRQIQREQQQRKVKP